MKHPYLNILIICLLSLFSINAQTFDFSIEYVGINSGTGNYQFALIATPSSMVNNGVTADMGAGFYVPTGLTIGNFEAGDSAIPASDWSSTSLGSNASGDAYFLSRVEAGGSSTNLNGTDPFQLVIFDVIANPNPSAGSIVFVENGDPIFNTLFVENYININLGSGTTNAYNQNDPAANSIDFSTLSLEDFTSDSKFLKLYPIPVEYTLKIDTNYEIDYLAIYDLTGKLMVSTSDFQNGVDVEHLSNGVYFIKLEIKDVFITKRFIKQ